MNKLLHGVLALLAISTVSANELVRPDFCIDEFLASSRVDAVTEDISFSGIPMILNSSWIVPHSVLKVKFAGEDPLVWDPMVVGVEELGHLGDWIDTAITLQNEFGFWTFAVRDIDGEVWLANQFLYEGEFKCFAHPLGT